MRYQHIQRGYFHHVLRLVAVGMLVGAWLSRHETVPAIVLLVTGLVVWMFGAAFQHLLVRDEGRWLAVRFGPLPLLGTRIAYDQIESVEPDRTTLLDGWGVHWFPGRGTTYNIWGFDCVKLRVAGRTIRIGTDDVEGLARFLAQQIPERAPQVF